MSARFVVVAGTDTGVGKTFVASGIARALATRGLRVVAVKPVETGCASPDPADGEDGVELARATAQREPLAALERLRAPLAPAVAAELEGASIDVDALTDRIAACGRAADVVLVEGAGGLLSTLSWTRDLTHVASRLDAPVLLVGADRLGTLNHVRLSLQVLLDAWVMPLGVVLSAPPAPDASTGRNAAALRRLSPIPQLSAVPLADRLLELPRLAPPDDPARALSPVTDWILAR